MNQLAAKLKSEPLLVGAILTALGTIAEQWQTTGQVPAWPAVILVFAGVMRQFVSPAK